jgi:hypothetical protein
MGQGLRKILESDQIFSDHLFLSLMKIGGQLAGRPASNPHPAAKSTVIRERDWSDQTFSEHQIINV